MKNEVVTVILAFAIAFSGGVGYFLGLGIHGIPPSSKTTTSTSNAPASQCRIAAPLQGLPLPGTQWFTAGVDYVGPWEATAVVHDNGSSVFAQCYVGTGQGFFGYTSASISKDATMFITAVKLDKGTGILFVAVNGSTNSTDLSYGQVTVLAYANYANFVSTADQTTH